MPDDRLFEDDTLMFNVVLDTDIPADVLNDISGAVQNWTYQGKMSFSPDPTKQAEKVIFSGESSKADHPAMYYGQFRSSNSPYPQHIGLILEEMKKL